MASITTRAAKGTPLTHDEVDGNFTNLNADKLETSTAAATYAPKASPAFTGVVSVAAGSAGSPSVAITGDANTGLFSPGSDQLSFSTGGVERLRIDAAGQIEAVSLGSAAAPAWSYVGDPNTGIYSPGADTLAASTAGNERARIDSSGRLLVGTSTALSNVSISGTLAAPTVQIQSATGGGASASITRTTAGPGYFTFNAGSSGNNVTSGSGLGAIQFNGFDGTNYVNGAFIQAAVDGTPGANSMPGRIVLSTTASGASSPTERMRIDSAGFVSLGGDTNTGFSNPSADNLAIATGGTERARIDSSGRLLVGTSSSIQGRAIDLDIEAFFQQAGTTTIASTASIYRYSNNTGPAIKAFHKSRGASLGVHAVVQSADLLGALTFAGSDGTKFVEAARIISEVDGTPGTNDMPGRLVFSTTADGASSPTERVRISSTGLVTIAGDTVKVATAKTPASATAAGTAGEICWDANYVYVCTATNTWKRSALSTW